MDAFLGRFLDVDAHVGRISAGLHVPDPAPIRDSFIAQTALALDMTVVTRNASDFQRFDGVRVTNPWSC